GGAERMAHGNRAAIDVDLVGIDLERLHVTQDDGGERLVELEKVDVGERHAGPFEDLLGHVDRPGEHDGRLRPYIGESADAGAWLQIGLFPDPAVAKKHG